MGPGDVAQVLSLVRSIQRAASDVKFNRARCQQLMMLCLSIEEGVKERAHQPMTPGGSYPGLSSQDLRNLILTLIQTRDFLYRVSTTGFLLQFFQTGEIARKCDFYKDALSGWEKRITTRISELAMDRLLLEREDREFDQVIVAASRHRVKAKKIYDGAPVNTNLQKFSIDPRLVQKGREIGKFEFGAIYEGFYDGKIVHVKEIYRDLDPLLMRLIQRGMQINRYLKECTNILQMLYIAGNRMLITEASTLGCFTNLPYRLDKETKLMIARKLASAVAYIHSCNIIHRDIRGRNVMIGTTESGLEPKLGGFETSKDEAASSLVHGPTTYWHAPEREKYGTSFLTDVYAFGILMYEISLQREPSSSDNAVLVTQEYGSICLPYSSLMKRCLAHTSIRPTMDAVAKELSTMSVDPLPTGYGQREP
ncbi:hypothetical protein DFQ26_004067 [Actinomortierella ambigua]|nr:hypothetical protein DFQ26_004067 [Actinomortierella ambigua]